MKKTYQSPVMNVVKVVIAQRLLEASRGGVATGGTLGNDYVSTDVSYSRRRSLWDDDEE